MVLSSPEKQRPRQAKRQKLKDSSASAYIGAGPLDGSGGDGSSSGAVVTSDGGKDVSVPGFVCMPVRHAWERARVNTAYFPTYRTRPHPPCAGAARAARGAI